MSRPGWLILLIPFALAAAPAGGDGPRKVTFNRDVRPILSDRCYACHGPDKNQRKTNVRFDREQGAFLPLAGGGQAIVRGKPEESVLLQRVTSSDPVFRMPPAYAGRDPLSNAEIETLRLWIAQGAEWEKHWSFIPPQKPALPAVERPRWAHNPIDRFVLARLEEQGLEPSPAADRRTLIRRASLDLTGLPPTPEEVQAFVDDRSPNAFEKVVDRLLQSPRFGEHLAAVWLDAARYADTNGYQTDGERSMWRWRDWVVDALNRNMPFDRFTVEQLAGDLLPGATRSQIIASGFNRNHRTTAEGGSVDEEFRVEYVADRAETTATVWLGLTVGCARCHDHKFDPVTQKEFYRLFAYFNNVEEKGMVWNFGNEDPVIKAPLPEQEAKLAALDAQLETALRKFEALAGRIEQEQAEWEAGLRKSAQRNWTPSRGAAAYFPLNGEYEIDSFTGGSVDGKTAPDPTETVFGKGRFGRAVKFDGTRYIDGGAVGNYNYLEPMSVSAWIYPTKKKDGAIVSSMTENPIGSGWGLFLRGGKLWWHMSQRWTDLSLRLETKNDIAVGRWQHVALTYDGKRKSKGVRVYVDGVEQEVEILFDNLDWPSRSNAPLKIGGGGGLDNRFAGLIDEVRLYGRELTADEARASAVAEDLGAAVRTAEDKRGAAQEAKLRLAFLEEGASAAVRRLRDEWAEARKARDEYYEAIPTVMVMKEGPKRQAYVLNRGLYDAPGEKVEPGIPAALAAPGAAALRDRLELARWLVDRANPLTARVTVNRFWQMLFGIGLVKTVDDFGSQGETPANQELLDRLAVDFMESGWDIKRLFKTMATSSAYRQSSRVTPELLERDPENRLLARGPRRRLAAGVIRDQALAISGLLVEKVGGPSVKPYQPPGLWSEVSAGKYRADTGEGLYRRSLYTYWKRTVAPPLMMNFDASDREVCTVHAVRTNTPLQALNLMNDVTFVEASRHFAERLLREGGDTPEARIQTAYALALGRPARGPEVSVLAKMLDSFVQRYADDLDAAEALLSEGDSAWDDALDARELAAYAGLAGLMLNLDETVTNQ